MDVSPLGPKEPTYHQEVKQSINLFEQSFQGMQQSQFNAQKDQYVKVMKESLSAIQDVANATVNKHLSELKDQLSNDLDSYIAHPDDAHRRKVETDIREIKYS